MGKCPGCQKLISSVAIEPTTISLNLLPQWRGVSYLCPHCSTILSVQIDPVGLKADLRKEILHELQERKP